MYAWTGPSGDIGTGFAGAGPGQFASGGSFPHGSSFAICVDDTALGFLLRELETVPHPANAIATQKFLLRKCPLCR